MLTALKERFIEIDFIRYNIGIASGEERERKRNKKKPSNDLTVGNLLSL